MNSTGLPPVIDGTLNPSFCFLTITERWPKIVTKIIDQLHQFYPEAEKKYGEQGGKDVKDIISKIAEMRYLMVTGKPLFNIASAPDADVWNSQLDNYRSELGESNCTWFKLPWLFVECYMYRKIYEFFISTVHLKDYDFFEQEKQRSYAESSIHMIAIATELVSECEKELSAEDTRKMVMRLFQVSLWGNKCDLSLFGGDPHCLSDTIFQELVEMRPNILVDNLDEVCDNFILKKKSGSKRIDIILDNAGLEVFTDLCLADFLLSKKLAGKIVFHGKAIPWFVSDTMRKDFDWVIEQLSHSDDPFLSKVGVKWGNFVNEKRFEFKAHPFWTYGFAYFEMKNKASDLYADLSAADLLIFKGDLNYRKLVDDRYWPLKTEFKTAIRGFEPTTFLSLRTLKAETLAGLSDEAVELIQTKYGKKSKAWMITGDNIVINVDDKIMNDHFLPEYFKAVETDIKC